MEAAAAVVDVNAEAKRILAVSIGKLYASRGQRGGLGLHRGLLLSLVMRSARDIYHAAAYAQAVAVAAEEAMDTAKHAAEEAMDTAKHAEEVEDESGSSGSGAPPGNSSTTTEPEKVELECTEEGGEEDTIKAEVSSSRTDTRRGEDKKKEEKEDKENMNPRKRRGKASVAPDFLPSKKARLEEEEEQPAEERRHHHQGPAVVPGGLGAASCRVADKCLVPPHPFSSLNRPAVIPAC